MIRSILTVLRIYWHLPHILVSIVDRIEALEQGSVQQAYDVRTVYVPHGMSTEVAWQEYRDLGKQYGHESSRKERVLVDNEENLLAILRS